MSLTSGMDLLFFFHVSKKAESRKAGKKERERGEGTSPRWHFHFATREANTNSVTASRRNDLKADKSKDLHFSN